LQIGSMPHELTLENIDRFAKKVLPELRGHWDDEGYVNHWWPEKLRNRTAQPAEHLTAMGRQGVVAAGGA
jgi:arginine/ornithine N-succinyltransferase beta subunit